MATKEKIKQKPTENSIEKIETYCRYCRAVLRYPSGYQGHLTCPRCKRKFKVNSDMGIGMILFISSIAVFILTIIITLIISVSGDESSNNGQLGGGGAGAGMAAGAVCMGGLLLSVILIGLGLMFDLAMRPMR